MDDVRGELDRLRRAWARTRARRIAGRTHLVVLGAALVAAFGSRVLGPWPGVGALEGRWIATGLAVVALALFGPALARPLARLLHPPRVVLARRLDDALAWHDAADTALGLGTDTGRLDAFLTTQTTGRLRGLDAGRLWPWRASGRWTRRILLVLFAFVLLAPGVTGLFDEPGAGRGRRPGLGSSPQPRPDEPLPADVWQRDHMRLFLRADAPRERPLEIRVRWKTDEELPAAWRGDLVLHFDGEEIDLETVLAAEAGEEVDRTVRFDLAEIEALEELLTPGRHVAQAWLKPTRAPWRTDLPSRRLEIVLEDGGGGGDGEGDQEHPQAPETPEQPTPQPEPEAHPQPEPPPPPVPEGPEEVPAPPPPGAGPEEVVDPLVRDPDETVHKEDALVAVPDPKAGLKPPPPVPLSEALREFDRIVEQALGDERVPDADRAYLLRYFRALRGDAQPAAADSGGGR